MIEGLGSFRDELHAGRPIIIPTDTVYGIAVLPGRNDAVKRVFDLKARPLDKPMPVLGDDPASLHAVARFDRVAEELAGRFWPGPLTIVLPRADGFEHDLGGSFDPNVAVRVPDRQLTLELLREFGPLAVTSANPSGKPAASSPDEARAYFGERVPIVEDGPVAGTPSTVVSLSGAPKVLREGPITAVQLGL